MLHAIQDDVEDNTYDPETLRERINNGRSEPVGADVHLVVSNKVRKQLNAKLNKGKTGPRIQAEDTDIYLQSYVLHEGLRVMKVPEDVITKYIKSPKIRIKKTDEEEACPIKKIHNGSMYEVESWTDKTITLVRLKDFVKTETKVVLPFDATKFGYYFTIAWAMTVYKAQGCNIDRPHVMHEFHRICEDKNYVYTSITRTTKQAHLYISKF
jgi:ATP-dependent exoDNAse (exonuclease V) alpha subunit